MTADTFVPFVHVHGAHGWSLLSCWTMHLIDRSTFFSFMSTERPSSIKPLYYFERNDD